MGWTSYHATHYKHSKGSISIDRKAEVEKSFGEGYEILKSSMVGSVHYAAVRKVKQYTKQNDGTYMYVDIPKEKQIVFATVTLTRTDMTDYYNFAYKDMDESMGPCESNCPLSILELLSPTEDCYAIDWRKRCEQNAERKKKII